LPTVSAAAQKAFRFPEIIVIGRIHRPDDANEAVEVVSDQAVAGGKASIDRHGMAPRSKAAGRCVESSRTRAPPN
jgi:hypothetical protein